MSLWKILPILTLTAAAASLLCSPWHGSREWRENKFIDTQNAHSEAVAHAHSEAVASTTQQPGILACLLCAVWGWGGS